MRTRVFAIAAHPDDIEFGMAGTMLLLKQAGCELHYMNVANGCCGSAEMDAATTIKTRDGEARAAAKLLGATFHEPIANDLEIFYEKNLLARLGSIVRQVNPDIVLVPSPLDYMEDHTNTCRLAVSAVFCRGMRNFPVTPQLDAVDKPVRVYHAQPHGHTDGLNRFQPPDFVVDVDSVIDEKTAVLAAHKSQQAWLDTSQAMNAYLQTLRDLSKRMGELTGKCTFGEGWRKHNHLGFCEEGFDPLADKIGRYIVSLA